ncbi:MAG: phosphohydrolase [Firmicutes bacterium HGW-Firmicutes-13]|nr:MAG: phosphohydrolase [Firmicutes bacterium HGW-Firmicutes-13]
MELEKIHEILRQVLTKERYLHSLGVEKASVELALIHGEDKVKAKKAGLLHDYGKQFSAQELLNKAEELGLPVSRVEENNPELLHAPIGALLVERDLGIKDEEILEAISCHTTGEAYMSRLSRIVFLADYIEENRTFPGIEEIRDLSRTDLDMSVLRAIDRTILYVIERGFLLHPKSVHFRNTLILKMQR